MSLVAEQLRGAVTTWATALRDQIELWRGHPLLPFLLLGLFVVFAVVHLSPWLVVMQAGALLPLPLALLVGFVGVNIGANLYFLLGYVVGARPLTRFIPDKVRRFVDRASLWNVMWLRMLPVLPFYISALGCGALRLRYRTFAPGTAIGVMPGVVLFTLVGDRIFAIIQHPTRGDIATLIGVAVVAVLTAVLFRKRVLAVFDPPPIDEKPA